MTVRCPGPPGLGDADPPCGAFAALLGGACFTGADLQGATIGNSTALGDAVFCNTCMPDGTIDDSGRDRGTPCCPACRDAGSCPAGQTCCDGNRCVTGGC